MIDNNLTRCSFTCTKQCDIAHYHIVHNTDYTSCSAHHYCGVDIDVSDQMGGSCRCKGGSDPPPSLWVITPSPTSLLGKGGTPGKDAISTFDLNLLSSDLATVVGHPHCMQ